MSLIVNLDDFRSQALSEDSFYGQEVTCLLPPEPQGEDLQSTGRHPKSKSHRRSEAEKRLVDPVEQGFGESLETARVAHARSYTALKVLSMRIESVMREIALEWQGGGGC